MKWLLIVVLLLAGLLILVVITGALLPQKHRVARTVSLRQPADTVWGLISGPPNWRPDIQKYGDLPSNQSHRMWRETDKHGQAITYEAIESIAPRRLVTRIADPKLPFGGTWTYEIVPAGQSCSLTITEDGEVYNPIFRFVSRFVIGQASTLDAYMKALSAKLDG